MFLSGLDGFNWVRERLTQKVPRSRSHFGVQMRKDQSAITLICEWMAAWAVWPFGASDFSEAKVLWGRRQQIVPPIRTERTIDDLLGDGVSAFEGRNSYMVAYA